MWKTILILVMTILSSAGFAAGVSKPLTSEAAVDLARPVAEIQLQRAAKKKLDEFVKKYPSHAVSDIGIPSLQNEAPTTTKEAKGGWEIGWEAHPPAGWEYTVQIFVIHKGKTRVKKIDVLYANQ